MGGMTVLTVLPALLPAELVAPGQTQLLAQGEDGQAVRVTLAWVNTTAADTLLSRSYVLPSLCSASRAYFSRPS